MTTPIKIDAHLTDDHAANALRSDVTAGLTSIPKWLPPKWLYDARGSELFERITELPEYYPTRTERELLRRNATEIARAAQADALVELGSGSSEKTRLLLDACIAEGGLERFIPLDVSQSALRGAAEAISRDYPLLAIHGAVADFTEHLDVIPGADAKRRMVAFLGGTIGNLLPAERAVFFESVHDTLREGELLLLGAGLVIDPAILVPAYDDAAGVTAEFNRNVLRVLNRELGADFDVESFEHVALWDAENEWIEMRLRAQRDMTVTIPAVDLTVGFGAGEELHTEVSAKFRREGLAGELKAAGFEPREWWTDPDDRFALTLAARV